MNKFLRIISTLVVGIGLILLFVYLGFQNSMDKSQVLNQPSYYTLQNYWYLLVAGCGCVAFSIISCFLAWNKKMDDKVEILPNAVAAEKTELLGWLSGSSLDTDKKRKHKADPTEKEKQGSGMPVMKRGEETETESPRKAAKKAISDTADTKTVTRDETVLTASEETEIAKDETVPEGHSSMTVLDTDATVLTDESEITIDDDSTVIENK